MIVKIIQMNNRYKILMYVSLIFLALLYIFYGVVSDSKSLEYSISEGAIINRDSCLIYYQRSISDKVVRVYNLKTLKYLELEHTHPYLVFGISAPGFSAKKGDSLIKNENDFTIRVVSSNDSFSSSTIYYPLNKFDCSYWDAMIR